jgi:hypothetical protein
MWIQKTANTNLYQGKITISFIKHGTKRSPQWEGIPMRYIPTSPFQSFGGLKSSKPLLNIIPLPPTMDDITKIH